MEIPKSFYVYEFSYPEEMPDLASVIFYVGKGTHASRMDDHLREASGECKCKKCRSIRSVWNAGLAIVRRIVFESIYEDETLKEERRRILLHQSPHLTNVMHAISIPSQEDLEGDSTSYFVPMYTPDFPKITDHESFPQLSREELEERYEILDEKLDISLCEVAGEQSSPLTLDDVEDAMSLIVASHFAAGNSISELEVGIAISWEDDRKLGIEAQRTGKPLVRRKVIDNISQPPKVYFTWA